MGSLLQNARKTMAFIYAVEKVPGSEHRHDHCLVSSTEPVGTASTMGLCSMTLHSLAFAQCRSIRVLPTVAPPGSQRDISAVCFVSGLSVQQGNGRKLHLFHVLLLHLGRIASAFRAIRNPLIYLPDSLNLMVRVRRHHSNGQDDIEVNDKPCRSNLISAPLQIQCHR
jgi:hypothetical protein